MAGFKRFLLSGLIAVGLVSGSAFTDAVASGEVIAPPVNPEQRYAIEIPAGKLPELMKWHPARIPLVAAHRGGPMPGYPENALETMDHAMKYGPAILEVDVRKLKDGTLILMHDRTLERTTTGEGSVAEANWDDVKDLYLEDNDGTLTEFRVPTLQEALTWAKGRVILNLDIKRGVDIKNVVKAVREAQATDYVMLISYTLDQAKNFHAAGPEFVINVGMNSQEQVQAAKESGIKSDRIVAWTGLRLRDKALYDAIHAEGWRVTLGTLGFDERAIDHQIMISGKDAGYIDLFNGGVDVISTDRYWAAQKVILSPSIVFFRAKMSGRTN